jgi:chromosome segregation ATPase
LSLSGGRTGNLQHDEAYYESRIRELSMKLSRLESNHSQCDHEKSKLREEIESLRIKGRGDNADSQLREELSRLNIRYR